MLYSVGHQRRLIFSAGRSLADVIVIRGKGAGRSLSAGRLLADPSEGRMLAVPYQREDRWLMFIGGQGKPVADDYLWESRRDDC